MSGNITHPSGRFAVVVSRYNATITDRLREGALAAFASAGGDASGVSVFEAPGAFELPALAHAAAESGRFRGVVALGCVIRGETSHDRYISQAVADGLVRVTLQTGVPVAFGLLTVETAAQAEARAGGALGNKGAEAMEALLETVRACEAIARGDSGSTLGAAAPDKASGAAR